MLPLDGAAYSCNGGRSEAKADQGTRSVQRTRTSSGTSIRQRRLLGLLVAALAAIGGAGCGSAHSPSHIPLSSPPAARAASTSAKTPATLPPTKNFLKSEPPITEGTPDSGEWQIGLNRSLVSETPISGTAPTKPTDRLLELRVTITYRTPGPPGEFGLAAEKFALVEVPQDLGLTHAPSATEQEDAGPESKDIACGATGFAGLCEVIGSGVGPFELYADEDGAPGGAISQAELRYLNHGESESFWLVGHVSEKIQPTHVALVFEDQLLSELPVAAQRVARGEAP
jgi:hypothetical protein